MVRNKETFERWSSQRRPTNAQLTVATKERRRTKEKPTSMRSKKNNAEKLLGKGMKQIPSTQKSFPLSSTREATGHSTALAGGREVSDSPPVLNFPDSDSGKSDSTLHLKKDSCRVPEKERCRRHEVDFVKESVQIAREDRPTKKHIPKRCRPEDLHQIGFIEKRGRQWDTSRKKSGSGSSGSVERQEVKRRRNGSRSSKKASQRGSGRSYSHEEENSVSANTNESSRSERRRSSGRGHAVREVGVDRSKQEIGDMSGSQESESNNDRCFLQQSPVYEGRMSRHHGNEHRISEGGNRDVVSLSEEGTDQSEESLRQREGKLANASCSSASEGPTEVKEEGVVSVKSETELRKERRDRQKLRERGVRRREKDGQKAYYLQVNHNGKPYGDGSTAWRADLNKLARGLDPSVMDVREQPPTEMSTLRRRLRQNFEYSRPVDPIHIRQLVGRAITQWRNTLWKKMDGGQSRPKGFDKEIWDKLQKTRSCPSHAEKSERMRHANSCRITHGRTGPRGEEGIREMLRLKKGASPDYDDVFTEMQRDKVYGGLAAQRKMLKRESGAVGVHLRLEGVVKENSHVQDNLVKQSINHDQPMTSTAKAVEEDYVRDLESQIAKLQAEVALRSKGTTVNSEDRDYQDSAEKEVHTVGADDVCEGEGGKRRGEEGNNKVCEGPGHVGSNNGISRKGSAVTDGRKKLRSQKVS